MSIQIIIRDEKLSAQARHLIDNAVSGGRVMVVQPAAASGNEASRSTCELVARRRREFRAAKRLEEKAKSGK